MLRKLIVGNFKAIGATPIDLDLRPLTLLVGRNGSGKSSALEGLALLAQSVRPAMKFGLETGERLVSPLVLEDETVAPLHHSGRVDQRQIQIVVTTHAPDLVLAVCRAVKLGVIPASDIAIYQFERDEKGARAERLPIGAHGVLEKGWIETFAKPERELLGALMAGDEGEGGPELAPSPPT